MYIMSCFIPVPNIMPGLQQAVSIFLSQWMMACQVLLADFGWCITWRGISDSEIGIPL